MLKIAFCHDKGYDSREIEYNNVVGRGYMYHIRYRCKTATPAIRMSISMIQEVGSQREPTFDLAGSENCLRAMKRNGKTIFHWYV
jgi:hypothetical protein